MKANCLLWGESFIFITANWNRAGGGCLQQRPGLALGAELVLSQERLWSANPALPTWVAAASRCVCAVDGLGSQSKQLLCLGAAGERLVRGISSSSCPQIQTVVAFSLVSPSWMFSLVKISGGIFFHWMKIEVKEKWKRPDLCSKDNDLALYPVWEGAELLKKSSSLL